VSLSHKWILSLLGLKENVKKPNILLYIGRRKIKNSLPEINQHKFALLFFELESSKGD
jgi:hypothetical protein